MTMPIPRNPATFIDDPRDDEDDASGDAHAADIVSRTGEEMPIQRHAQVHPPAPPTSRDDPQS